MKIKFKQLKYDFLKHAKDFCFTEKYSIFCTGKSAFICDRALKLLCKIENLSYFFRKPVNFIDAKSDIFIVTS